MATTLAPRANTPNSRRSPPSASSSPPSITKGTTARSAASPRIPSSLSSPVARRQSLKLTPSSQLNGEIRETRESLSSSLKHETEKREQLLVQLQNKDQTIASLTSENTNLSSALGVAETRINDFYADQSRMEDEMAARIEVSEKLREQVRELEKEKRDLQRRYNEQTSTFEAERQAFYDNEQHLKSRIQSFTQIRKPADAISSTLDDVSEVEPDVEDEQNSRDLPQSPKRQDLNDPETEPAEMTSLRLELSTLSTSYTSLQSTLVLLQTQLFDLTRVNRELQEENESYMILLREKTLSGQFDLLKQVAGTQASSEERDEDSEGVETDADDSVDVGSLRSIGRSTLDRVDEMPEDSLEHEHERSLQPRDTDSSSSMHRSRHSRQGRKRGTPSSHSPSGARGESLAGLPITGPGLDLAAELGRAENKDVLSGNPFENSDRFVAEAKGKGKKDAKKLSASETQGLEPNAPPNDIDALRTEIKALKDANKALSLYASKIIDRIISQEGFEHVLAIDYQAQTPSTASPPAPIPSPKKSPAKVPKARPQSVMVSRSISSPMPSMDSFKFGASPQTAVPKSTAAAPTSKANRRSLSFDWKSFSMFGGGEKKAENPGLRPLTLKPGSTTVTGGRKLETFEDENDRRERERLNATMKLMGIDKPSVSPLITSGAIQKSFSSPAPSPSSQPTATQSRFSFFRSRTTTASSDNSSVGSTSSRNNSRVGLGIDASSGLTTEALARAEAEESLAALDAHERALSAEIARGSGSGFTEISRVGSRRHRKSSGSASTVWSAGMGRGDDEGHLS